MTMTNDHPIYGNADLARIFGTIPNADQLSAQLEQAELGFDDPETLAPLFSEQSTFSKSAQPRTTFWRKVTAAAALENVSGRLVFAVDRFFADPLPYDPVFRGEDGKLTTEFDVDDWVAQNQSDLNSSEVGKVILRNYSLGRYDHMDGRQFFTAVGYDHVEDSLRQDLAASTGTLAGDFGGVVLGAALDPTALVGGAAVLRGAGLAKNLKATRSLNEAWQRTKTYRQLVKTTPLSKAGFIGEQAKQAAAIGVFTEPSLQLLDQNRELEDFADNLVANVSADILLSSLFAVFTRKPIPGQSLDQRYREFVSLREKALANEKEKLVAASTISPSRATPTGDSTGINGIAVSGEMDSPVSTAPAASFSDVAEAQAQVTHAVSSDPVASSSIRKVEATKRAALNDANGSLFDETTAEAASAGDGTGSSTIDRGAFSNTAPSSESPTAPRATETVSALKPEDQRIIRDLLTEMQRQTETPINPEVVMEQLNRIANRGVQLFNFGRLDSIGLRKVKIEQPVQVIAERVVNEGLDLTLENILAELKKATPQEAIEAIKADPQARPTLEAFTEVFGGDERAAASAMINAAQAMLSSRGDTSLSKFKAQTRKLKPTAQRSLGLAIDDITDYLPDRSNDRINKALNRLAEKLERVPFLSNLVDPLKPGEVRSIPSAHAGWTLRKYMLHSNPILSALANTFNDRLLPMKAQTKGTVRNRPSIERAQKRIRQRSRASQSILFQTFNAFARKTGLASLPYQAMDLTGQTQFAPQEYLKLAEHYYGLIEKLRLETDGVSLSSNPDFYRDGFLSLDEEPGVRFAVEGMMPAPLRAALEQAGTFQQAIPLIVEDARRLAELGVTTAGPNTKLASWMTQTQRQVLGAVTSIRIDPDSLSLDELDEMMGLLFNQNKPDEVLFAGDATLFDERYSGLRAFISLEEIDEATQQFIRKYGVRTKDEIIAAASDPLRAKQVVRAIVDSFNTQWGGLIPVARVERLYSYLHTLERPEAISFSTMRTLSESSRFLEKLEMAEQLSERLRELEKFRIQREFSQIDQQKILRGEIEPETTFTPIIRQYDSMRYRLVRALLEAQTRDRAPEFESATPQFFHYYSLFADKAVDAIAAEAKEYGQLIGLAAKQQQSLVKDADTLARTVKDIYGLSPRSDTSSLGRFAVSETQAFMLGRTGVTQLIDESKKAAVLLMQGGVGNGLRSLFDGYTALLVNARKSGISNADLGIVYESLQTHLEDVRDIAARRMESTGGEAYFESPDQAIGDKLSSAHRSLIGKLSGMELVTDISKMTGLRSADTLLSSPNGLIAQARKVVDLIETEKLSPIEATRKVSKAPLAYHNYSKIASNLSHDEIKGLDDLFNSGDAERIKVPVKRRFGLGSTSIEAWDLPENATERQRDLLRRYAQLLDYWVEKELLNVPTASSNLAIGSPEGFLNRAMTMFLRTTVASIDNMTIAQANVPLAARVPLFVYMTSVAFGTQFLKAALSGEDGVERFRQKLDGGVTGNLELAAEALDYSGFMGILASKGANFALDLTSPSALDRANAGEFQVLSPVQSTLMSFGRAIGGGLESAVTGEDMPIGQQRTLRKLLSGNMTETTLGGLVRGGMRAEFLEDTPIGELGDWLYPTRK